MKFIQFALILAALVVAGGVHAATREGLIAEGERAMMNGNMIVAERAFVIGMNNHPDDPRFPYYAGVAAYYLERYDDAKRRLVLAVEAYPRAQFFLAMIELEASNADAALRHINGYLERVPRDPDGEILRGIALLAKSDPSAVKHFNLAAQLDKNLRAFALFFRGLSQFERNQLQGADKALRAVMRLGEHPTMLQLAEQTLDVMRSRGDVAETQWVEAYMDIIYDDNLNRDLDRNPKVDGMRLQLRGRYWRQVIDKKPTLIVGGWLDHDQPVGNDATGRSQFGALMDMGYYKGLDKLSLDPGVEFEPSMTLSDGGGGYGLGEIAVALRPRLYIFQDHERSTKLFYEFKYVEDIHTGFFSGPRHVIGARPSWTGRNRRTYVSGLVALQADSTSADAYRSIGPRLTLDAQAATPSGFLAEFTAVYHKAFYRDVRPLRQEDTLIGHLGIGWWLPSKKFVFLVGSDQELHLSTERGRDWTARMYWMRLGAYL